MPSLQDLVTGLQAGAFTRYPTPQPLPVPTAPVVTMPMPSVGGGPDRSQLVQTVLALLASGGGPGGRDGGGAGGGQSVFPNGDTDYRYQAWAKPYYGTPQNLTTRRGITLQPGPMRSLIDIARASNVLPGTQEIGKITQGYRSQAAQKSAAVTNPNAADYGYSYHPEGLAIDASWWTAHPELARALAAAGWNQLPSESWHWSYGVQG